MEESKIQTLIIEAGRKQTIFLRDLWNYRELFFFLAWRDLIVRYKQTIIGFLWAILRPFMTMVILTIVFNSIANISSGAIPYPVLVYTAVLPWTLFAESFSDSSNSLINNTNLLTKIYFPRIIIPMSTIIVNLVDFCISFGIFVGVMIWFQFVPLFTILMVPLLILLTIIIAFGLGLLISALNVKFRDFRYIVPFIIQFGLYISPVGYNSTIIPPDWRLLFSINPVVGIIDCFRWAILGYEFYLPSLLFSIVIGVVMFFIGLWYFGKTERYFADII